MKDYQIKIDCFNECFENTKLVLNSHLLPETCKIEISEKYYAHPSFDILFRN